MGKARPFRSYWRNGVYQGTDTVCAVRESKERQATLSQSGKLRLIRASGRGPRPLRSQPDGVGRGYCGWNGGIAAGGSWHVMRKRMVLMEFYGESYRSRL
jgi:hypothetical protein